MKWTFTADEVLEILTDHVGDNTSPGYTKKTVWTDRSYDAAAGEFIIEFAFDDKEKE